MKKVLSDRIGSVDRVETNHAKGVVWIDDVRVAERKKSGVDIREGAIDSLQLGFSGAELKADHDRAWARVCGPRKWKIYKRQDKYQG